MGATPGFTLEYYFNLMSNKDCGHHCFKGKGVFRDPLVLILVFSSLSESLQKFLERHKALLLEYGGTSFLDESGT